MKRIRIILRQYEINKILGSELDLTLRAEASVIDVVKAVDRELERLCPNFPVKGYKSLLHMVYHPYENRFYEQVSVQAYRKPGVFMNIRKQPNTPLPDGATIILVPEGPCISEGEDVLDWNDAASHREHRILN